MIRRLFFSGLRDTRAVCEPVLAIRDGYVNLHVIRGVSGLICIDAGHSPRRVIAGFERLGLWPQDVSTVLLTHLHWDHARCAGLFSKARVFVGVKEPARTGLTKAFPPLERLRDGEILTASGLSVRVMETAGHTAGSVSYVIDGKFLFTGDALRLRKGEALPMLSIFNKDREAAVQSLQKLSRLSGIEWVFTAHSGATRDFARAFRRWNPSGASNGKGAAS